MDEKHLWCSRVPIHVEEGFQDVDHELHRCSFVIQRWPAVERGLEIPASRLLLLLS